MRIEIDLGTFGWPHIICLVIISLSIPEVYRRFTQLFVYLFAIFYRLYQYFEPFISAWLCCRSCRGNQASREAILAHKAVEIEREKEFKMLSPDQVAKQLKEDNENCNISGYVQFKWGFPYIFQKRHLQLYKTQLLIRDANAMKKYTQKRLELLHQQRALQQQQQQQQQQHSTLTPSSPNSPQPNITNEKDDDNDLTNIDSTQQTNDLSQILQSNIPITSRTFQPPKPLWVFNFTGGKVVNSRLPMTLKMVTTKTETCYLQFNDKMTYTHWCKSISKNLHIELTEKWRNDARQMLSNMQNTQQIEKVQNSTPVKKRPVLSPSSPGSIQPL